MLFGKKRKAADAATENDPIVRREAEIERLETEREALNAEIEELVKDYARAIGSRKPLKGVRRVGAKPNEYGFWHKKRK